MVYWGEIVHLTKLHNVTNHRVVTSDGVFDYDRLRNFGTRYCYVDFPIVNSIA